MKNNARSNIRKSGKRDLAWWVKISGVISTIVAIMALLFGEGIVKHFVRSGTNAPPDATPPMIPPQTTTPHTATGQATTLQSPIPQPATLQTNIVKVMLPSGFNDVDVTVDGKPGQIIERTLSSLTLRIVGNEEPHRFSFKKGSVVVREISRAFLAEPPETTMSAFSN